MKILVAVLFLFQFSNAQSTEQVKQEIRNLLQQLNQARITHDRAALERIYAPEFIIVHSAGFVDDRKTTIEEIMETDSIRPAMMPSMDGLLVYGNVAVLRIFNLTTAGTVNANQLANTYIYIKKDGRWQIAQAQGTPLQRERPAIQLDSTQVAMYVGKYQRNAGEYIIISKTGNSLLLHVVGRGIPKRKLMAASATSFFDKVGTVYDFTNEGAVIILTTRLTSGQQSKWNKIE